MKIQSLPKKPKASNISKRNFLFGGAVVAALTVSVMMTREKVDKVTSGLPFASSKFQTSPESTLPFGAIQAPEIDFTGEPIDIKPDIHLPQNVDSNVVYTQIAEFVKVEVLKFRDADASGQIQGNKADIIRNFVGWLNEQIASSSGVSSDVGASINNEKEQYFSENKPSFHENWEYRLNRYLIPAGYFLVTRPNEGVVQIFKIDQESSQYVDVKMGQDTYRTPMLQVNLISPNPSDPQVVGFLHDTNIDKESIAVIVRSGLELQRAKKLSLDQFKARAQNNNSADLQRFEREMAEVGEMEALRSIAQHELSHTVINHRFMELSNSDQKRELVVRWFGTRAHEQRYGVRPIEPNEMFAEGSQLAVTNNSWRQLMIQLLDDFHTTPRGKILLLQALMSAPDSLKKQKAVSALEQNDFNIAISNPDVVNLILEVVMSSDFTNEHAKKAGELYMKIGYSYFQ